MNAPSDWLVANRHLLPRGGEALDLACGRGRHALWLSEQGFSTLAVDRDEALVLALEQEAARRGLPLRARVVDLECGDPFPPVASFDVIVGVHYLHRPLFPLLVAALRPGGVLVYETFTRAQAARGKPTNPAFLLEAGELRRLVQPLEILAEREGEYEAGVIGRRRRQ